MITKKEAELLTLIIDSEYQDGNPINNDIWLDYVVDSKSRGGVLTSLYRKGLVLMHLVPMAKSDNRQNGLTDSTIAITAKGAEALLAYNDSTPKVL